MNEKSGWASWFRDNADKYLLVLAIFGVLGITIHVMHHSSDAAQLQFFNGVTNTLLGAFITLITGAIVRKGSAATTSTQDPESGRTVVTATATEDDKG
jgi:hypothetical protein